MLRFLTAVLLFSVGIAAFAQVRDFDMQTADGNAFSLDSIRTPLTLLYFQDPDCDMCHAVTDSLSRSAVVREAVANRRLTVLTVYVGDDRQLWESTLNRFPGEWTNVIDCTFSSLDKYAYSAPPALYLSGPDGDETAICASIHVIHSGTFIIRKISKSLFDQFDVTVHEVAVVLGYRRGITADDLCH